MLDRILARALSRPSIKAEPAPPPGRLRVESHWDPPSEAKVEKQISLYTKLTWVQIAVSISSQTCAATPYTIAQGERDIPDHDFLSLLKRPNPTQSRFEFLEATFSWRKGAGNASWWLNRPDPDMPPAELWIIPATKMQPGRAERVRDAHNRPADAPPPLDLMVRGAAPRHHRVVRGVRGANVRQVAVGGHIRPATTAIDLAPRHHRECVPAPERVERVGGGGDVNVGVRAAHRHGVGPGRPGGAVGDA